MYRILALDPGGTTGWATYTAQRMAHPEYSRQEQILGAPPFEYFDQKWACGQLGPEEHHSKLFSLLGIQQTSEFVLVCESFEFRNKDRRHRDNINLMSREYIGVATLFYQLRMEGRDGQSYWKQTAGLAKSFIPDSGPQANKKIKEAGLWHPNQVHAMDATRHLLWYLVNRDNRYDLVRRWWRPRSTA
jgi:hypothetical protein